MDEEVLMDETKEAMEMLGKGYHSGSPKKTNSTWSGFTPAPDEIIKSCDFITALVWGKVWRYCQGPEGICRAKLERMATELGMSDRTIMRHLETLTEKGYLRDTTPDLKNKPHIYADTGLLRIGISVEATVTESHPTMTESHREGDRESVEDSIKKVTNIQEHALSSKNKKIVPGIISSILQDRPTTEGDIAADNSGWYGRERLSEDARPLLDIYVELTLQHPTPSQLSDWMQAGNDWVALGAIPEDIRHAYKKSRPDDRGKNGFLVNRPGSLTNTIGMVVGERKQKQISPEKADPMETFNDFMKRRQNATIE